jgi:hypothetical protein
MMPQGIQAPKGVVQGMGHPGEGVPVARVEPEEGPAEERCVKRSDIGVLEDIEIVVPVHELVAKGREIDENGYKAERSRKKIFAMSGCMHVLTS